MSDYIPDDWPEAEGELPPSLEYLLGKCIQAIQKAIGLLKMNMNSVMTWYEAMRQAIITYIQAAYMAGQNSTYIGETEAGHIYDYVKTQVDYLNNFRLVVQSASEFNEGWLQRAESYARGIVAPYWKGRTKMLPLPAMPGDMSTDCGQLCACLWDVKVIDEKADDYDAYWLLNASRIVKTEHCQDCQTRAVVWNPLRIRGGVLQLEGPTALPSEFRFREHVETALKHLPGKHNQKTHGRRTGRGDEIVTGSEREKNFREWFGDSKVVDENGDPLVVYHGANKDFTEFSKDSIKSPRFGYGFYFSNNNDGPYARGSGAVVMPVHLSIKKPYYVPDGVIEFEYEGYSGNWMENSKNWTSDMQKKGYDGVIWKRSDGKNVYVAFESNQIKSVFNNGLFDASNPNILKEFRGKQ